MLIKNIYCITYKCSGCSIEMSMRINVKTSSKPDVQDRQLSIKNRNRNSHHAFRWIPPPPLTPQPPSCSRRWRCHPQRRMKPPVARLPDNQIGAAKFTDDAVVDLPHWDRPPLTSRLATGAARHKSCLSWPNLRLPPPLAVDRRPLPATSWGRRRWDAGSGPCG
jgi:hypothetical protein